MDSLERITDDPRVQIRKTGLNSEAKYILYWMRRSQRGTDNPALNVAIQAGNVLKKPVLVFFGLTPKAHHANLRHYTFLAQGLHDLAQELRQRNVGFVLRSHPDHDILKFCSELQPCLSVADENPLRGSECAQAKVAAELSNPLWSVDADVIVPTKLIGKEHCAARTIRPKIHGLLDEFLKPVHNPIAGVVWQKERTLIDGSLLQKLPIDRSVQPVSAFVGGATEAHRRLKEFLQSRLTGMPRGETSRTSRTSQLSPYLHFGHIAPHTLAMAVKKADAPLQDRMAFLEELIVRRELGDRWKARSSLGTGATGIR